MENKSSNRNRIVAAVVVVIIILVLLLAWCTNRTPQLPAGTLSPATASTTPGSAGPAASQPPGAVESTPTFTPLPIAVQAKVVILQVDVRTGPGLLFPILVSLPQDTILTVIGRNAQSTWLLILAPNGQQGWIPAVAVQLNVEIESAPIVEPTPEPSPGPTTSPYGQGMLGHPGLPGLAPAAQITAARKALAAFSILVLAFLAGGVRLALAWRDSKKALLAPGTGRSQWLARILTSLF